METSGFRRGEPISGASTAVVTKRVRGGVVYLPYLFYRFVFGININCLMYHYGKRYRLTINGNLHS